MTVFAADAVKSSIPKGSRCGIVQSVSWTLKEAVQFDRTRVTSHDWISYPILRFPEVPKVEVHLISRPEEKPLGAGEASMGPTVAAVVNAVSNALGRRVRDLPLTADRVLSNLCDAEPENVRWRGEPA